MFAVKDLVLVADDIEINRIVLREILIQDYDVIEAQDGTQVIDIMFNQGVIPTAVLLDINMPNLSGFEVLNLIRENKETENIPVLFITAADSSESETLGFKRGASDYIIKPFNPAVVKVRLENQIKLFRYQTSLEEMIEKKTKEVTKTYEHTLEVLATIIEYRSLESGTHIRRTSLLTEIMILEMLKDPEYGDMLKRESSIAIIRSSVLHDIGKIGIKDNVLLKPGRLTPEEFEHIKTHTSLGRDIIDRIATHLPDEDKFLEYSKEICAAHHERWDGKGYPGGLRAEEIPLSARVLSIVDVYDALVSKRCYKDAFSFEEAKRMIIEGAGTQFDPQLVRVFETLADRFEEIEKEYAEHMPDDW